MNTLLRNFNKITYPLRLLKIKINENESCYPHKIRATKN